MTKKHNGGYKLVMVEWVDSAMSSEVWVSKERRIELSRCVSVGFLLERTKEHITMTSDIGEEQYGRLIAIPRSCVKRTKKLKVRSPRI